jgi:chemotaxis signal transduction protein
MTFRVGGEWLAVRVEQMESVELVDRLWPVPLAIPEYAGLCQHADTLVPVLNLVPQVATTYEREQLVAVLHVRGEPVGLAIEKAGRVYEYYNVSEASDPVPNMLHNSQPKLATHQNKRFWLVDPDKLWLTVDERGPE